jgi:hypothetical protein
MQAPKYSELAIDFSTTAATAVMAVAVAPMVATM